MACRARAPAAASARGRARRGHGHRFSRVPARGPGHRVTGVDLADGMLNDARALAAERPSQTTPEFRTGDAMDPPLPVSSVDVVTNRKVTWTLLDPRRAPRNW